MNLKPNSNQFLRLPKIENRGKSTSKITTPLKKIFNFKSKDKSFFKFRGVSSDRRNLNELDKLKSLYTQEKDLISSKISNISKKITAITDLQKKYKIKFTQQEIMKLNEAKLESLAKQKFLYYRKVKAVQTISIWWKRILIISKLKQQEALLHRSAKKIQICWRKHLKRKAFRKHLKSYKKFYYRLVVKIQSHIRSFLVRQKTRVLFQRKKLEKNFEFFFTLKQKVLKSLLPKVLSIWKTYKIKENFIILYKKTIEKEKKEIMSLLKSSVSPQQIACQIKFILNKHEGLEKSKMSSQPNSPLLIKTRLRSCTEDFVISPRRVRNIAC